jgi:hypothetical protein
MELQNLLESFVHLSEKDMQEIKSFQIERVTADEPEYTEELFLFFYEMEYKYNAIMNHGFIGIPARKEKILEIIQEQSIKVIKTLIPSFLYVFKDWLSKHALTQPRQWAISRCEEMDYDIGDMLNIAHDEFTRYSSEDFDRTIEKNEKKFFSLTQFLDDINAEQEAEQTEGASPSDSIFVFYGSFYELYNALDHYNSDLAQEFIIEIYQYIVFPVWFAYWKSQGIVETRKRIKRLYDDLKKIASFPLKEQFGILNEATLAVHQGGSMMEYYEEYYQVEETFFDQFSNYDVDPWDAELREIGVEI